MGAPSDLRKSVRFGGRVVVYAVALGACALLTALLMDLPHADMTVPFRYEGDSIWACTWVKGINENGWVLENPRLGAPGEQHMQDYPIADNLHFGLLKLIGLAARDYAVTINIYYLLTFPLTTLTSLFVMRRFTRAALPPVVASLLYTFLPYHFMRGQTHLFLAAYYLVPLAVLMVLWLYDGSLLPPRAEGDTTARRVDRRKLAVCVCICLLLSAGGVYYAAFACYFLLAAGAAAALARREWLPLLAACGLSGVIVAGGVANLAPTYLYKHEHGANPDAVIRLRGAGEIGSFRFAQLVLPMTDHRLGACRRFKQRYIDYTPHVNENDFCTLGVVGAGAFVMLLGWPFYRANRPSDAPLLDRLAVLNALALLLGMVGGLGAVFSMHALPELRCYNRVCVYIAFFALLAGAVVHERIAARCHTRRARHLFAGGMAALLLVGVLDQTSARWLPDHAALGREVGDDATFVRAIEASVPEGSAIFQLPYVVFPEPVPLPARMSPYDHLRFYLHSHAIRWSSGGVKGRDADKWQKRVCALPPAQMVEELKRAGFAGVCVDRKEYADNGAPLEAELSRLAGPPLVHPTGRWVFYRLAEAGAGEPR